MDNQTRSEISRKKAIDAALSILTRDGVGGLTFDSLSRESGISKGGLLHQFRSKQGVLKALLEFQQQQFEQFAHDYLVNEGVSKAEPNLSAQIAIFREAINQPNSVARAVLAAIIESPELLEDRKGTDAARLKALDKESTDFELTLLRYFAASGIAFSVLLGLTPLTGAMRNRLFTRLLDDESWKTLTVKRKSR
ncbi:MULTISPECIES: TetR/AcrR family transcriptional regulator [unclassified Burkholderia]|uniref:TetR/AcrR family transcriptional regulator n=1 Tax=unclassified Burkholderia TaxID=2613784 RepID=UPI00075B201A|nr:MULTISPECIES: TetR/AcrR family transcriptional regulator [unclassified Burkholderia]KVN17898.1 TetR family transcriptional regulator [Burkholderia sp. MSMB1552]KWZ55551.1 TetR family transcriptional regulator [Burkholderia sp. MSMB1588]